MNVQPEMASVRCQGLSLEEPRAGTAVGGQVMRSFSYQDVILLDQAPQFRTFSESGQYVIGWITFGSLKMAVDRLVEFVTVITCPPEGRHRVPHVDRFSMARSSEQESVFTQDRVRVLQRPYAGHEIVCPLNLDSSLERRQQDGSIIYAYERQHADPQESQSRRSHS